MHQSRPWFVFFVALMWGVVASAQLQAKDAWVRAVVTGQQGTGAFMTLQASENLTITAASSPWAAVAQIHNMAMEGNVMKMAAVDSLVLQSGQALTLKPGGYHVMLMDLKEGFAKLTQLPLTISYKTASGSAQTLTLQVPVLANAPSSAPRAGGMDPKDHSQHMAPMQH
jgi:copper(I)-binding protein